MRHLISTDDLPDDDLREVVDRGVAHATTPRGFPRTYPGRPLDGAVVGVYFRKTSTRTRTAFSSGALRLGARVIAYGPEDLQTNTGESTEDTGRVFSSMLDALVARTTGPAAEMAGWARQDRMAVINAMGAEEHPTQALADLTTLKLRFGRIDGLRLLYLGEGNNTAAALALSLSRFPGVHLELRTPPGYGIASDVHERAAKYAAVAGATVHEQHDMEDLLRDVDVIYCSRWQTTGTAKPDPDWRTIFAPFQVTTDRWRDNPRALFMHDLPAHRGEEVTAEVLDGPASIAFEQAANKMFSAMAVLQWCLTGAR